MSTAEEKHLRRLTEAWAEGEARAYLKAYREVCSTLQELQSTHLLAQVVNNLLNLMRVRKLSVHAASEALMKEMSLPQSRMFVMAAAVDVLLNERDPKVKVRTIPDWKETLERAAKG